MKIRFFAILCAAFSCALLAACSRQATRPAVTDETLPAETQPAGDSITIDAVEVTQSSGVRISGKASLPPEGCLQTGLWIDDQPAGWWPSDVCIEPDAGEWEMVIALGNNDAPATLDPQASYELRAWLQGQSEQVLARHIFQVE